MTSTPTSLSHVSPMTNIELYGTEVTPRVRELLAESPVVQRADAVLTRTLA